MHQAFVAQSQFQELYGILCQWQQDLGIAIQQRNEAWNENYHLRNQVIAMSISNGALHEELQHFQNQLPNVSPGAAAGAPRFALAGTSSTAEEDSVEGPQQVPDIDNDRDSDP